MAQQRNIDLQIRKRQVTTLQTVFHIPLGQKLQITWRTDETMELFLHGYNLNVYANKAYAVTLSFYADKPGRFPITAQVFRNPELIRLVVYPK
jgi:hypothetical protein